MFLSTRINILNKYNFSICFALFSFTVLSKLNGLKYVNIFCGTFVLFLLGLFIDVCMKKGKINKSNIFAIGNITLNLVFATLVLTNICYLLNIYIYAYVLLFCFLCLLDKYFIGELSFKKEYFAHNIIYMMFVFSLLFFSFYVISESGNFSPDSFSYYEISQTFLKDFGNAPTIRQYVIPSDYSIAFPYLWPLFIFVINKITNLNLYSGILANIIISIVILIELLYISKKNTDDCDLGYLLVFIVFCNKYYLSEVVSARAIPLNIFLIFNGLYLIYKFTKNSNISDKSYLIPGAFLGAAVANRFDSIIAFVFFCITILIIDPNKGKKRVLYFVFGGLIFILPWIIYSLVRFNTLWITDNSGTFLYINTQLPNSIIESKDNYLTIFDSPIKWIKSVITKSYNVMISFSVCSYSSAILFIYSIISIVKYGEKKKEILPIFIVSIVVYYFVKTCMFCLVGYKDIRYHCETYFIVTIFVILNSFRTLKKSDKIFNLVLIIMLFSAFYQNHDITTKFIKEKYNTTFSNVNMIPEETKKILKIVNTYCHQNDGILLLNDYQFEVGPYDINHKYYIGSGNGNCTSKYLYAFKNGFIKASVIIMDKETYYSKDKETSEFVDYLITNYFIEENNGYYVIVL